MIIYFIITIIIPIIFIIINNIKTTNIKNQNIDHNRILLNILNKIKNNFNISNINYNNLSNIINNYISFNIKILDDIYLMNLKKDSIIKYFESFFIIDNNNEICFAIKNEFINKLNSINNDRINTYNTNNTNRYYNNLMKNLT